MEATLFRALCRHVTSVAHPRRPRVRFSDRAIVLVYLWSVLHDRPVTWACDRRHWPGAPPFELPSDTTMSRRLRTVGVLQLVERVTPAASDLFGAPPPLVKAIDSKPMTVGAYSTDADARRGRVGAGQMARGYRLHALAHGRTVRHWTPGAMNAHDSLAAPALLGRAEGGGYVVADNAYDTNALHALAAAANHQLVAPPKEAERHVRDARYNGPLRLRALDLLASPLEFCAAGRRTPFGVALYNRREAVESCFGELSLTGLNYLPAWARGPRRVALWAAGKILLHTLRCAIRQRLMA